MRVIAPTLVSFSTSEPRPSTTSSPIVTRSRTHDWSPRITRAPMREPAKTIAPVETIVPSPISFAGHEREELAALELERLVRGDLGNVDVARSRLPLAVRVDRPPGRLLV